MLALLLLPLLHSGLSLALVVTVSKVCHDADTFAHSGGSGGGGGGSRAAPPPAVPPSTSMQAQVVGGVLGALIQLTSALNKWDHTWSKNPWGVASALASILSVLIPCALIPALWPRFFRRHKLPLMASARVVWYVLPHVRNPRTIEQVFQGRPAGGAFAKLKDFWILFLGTKGIPLLGSPFAFPLPLLPHVALTAFAVQRCRTALHTCSLPLLQHDIWRRRIRWVHRVAEVLPLTTPECSLWSLAAADPTAACTVFTTFCQLAWALASLLLTARLQGRGAATPPASGGSASAPAAAGRQHPSSSLLQPLASGEPGGSDTVGPRSSSGGGSRQHAWLRGCASSCLRWPRYAAARADSSLQHLCDLLVGRAGLWVARLASWWLLLSFMWTLALVLEQPAAAVAAAQASCTAGDHQQQWQE